MPSEGLNIVFHPLQDISMTVISVIFNLNTDFGTLFQSVVIMFHKSNDNLQLTRRNLGRVSK